MNFESALEGLRRGHRLRRRGWTKDVRLVLRGNNIFEETQSLPAAFIGSISSEDILADDWELE